MTLPHINPRVHYNQLTLNDDALLLRRPFTAIFAGASGSGKTSLILVCIFTLSVLPGFLS